MRLHIEDGRNFLQTTRDRYDLITGEPPPPLTPGTVNLYQAKHDGKNCVRDYCKLRDVPQRRLTDAK